MTLQFSTKWSKKMGSFQGHQTLFVPQILNGLYKNQILDAKQVVAYETDYYHFMQEKNKYFTPIATENQKLHTIRADDTNRWYKGRDIHFKVWQDKPYHSDTFQFAPIIKCTSVQKIEIIYSDDELCDFHCLEPVIKIDNKPLSLEEVEELAVNDGFKDAHKFCQWFGEDFSGKLIHWTDLKY